MSSHDCIKYKQENKPKKIKNKEQVDCINMVILESTG